jgi:hypothetical protein
MNLLDDTFPKRYHNSYQTTKVELSYQVRTVTSPRAMKNDMLNFKNEGSIQQGGGLMPTSL